MLTFLRTDSKNEDFIGLVKLLDADLKISDGDEHDFYNQYNGIEQIKYALVAYWNEIPVSCGAIKEYDEGTVEVKRMFTNERYRGRKIATQILAKLEDWTKELGYKRCILETGKKQPEAVKLYQKTNYQIIENYGQYAGVENSVCFEKIVD